MRGLNRKTPTSWWAVPRLALPTEGTVTSLTNGVRAEQGLTVLSGRGRDTDRSHYIGQDRGWSIMGSQTTPACSSGISLTCLPLWKRLLTTGAHPPLTLLQEGGWDPGLLRLIPNVVLELLPRAGSFMPSQTFLGAETPTRLHPWQLPLTSPRQTQV